MFPAWLRRPLLIVFLLGVLGVSAVAAQAPQPINLNENKVGSIVQAGGRAEFTLNADAARSVAIQVLSIVPGLRPEFEVISPAGIIVGGISNTNGIDIVQGTVSLPAAGSYVIRVRSSANTTGDFLLSIQSSNATASPPSAITPGQVITGQVDSQTGFRAFSFTGSLTDTVFINVLADPASVAPIVTLKDDGTDEVLALSSARLSGVRYSIPPTAFAVNYVVEISFSGAGLAQAFSLCVEVANSGVTCPGTTGGSSPQIVPTVPVQPPQVTPTFQPVVIPPTGACQVASLTGATINVRQGPGLDYAIVTRLQPTQLALVFGRTPDNSWYQINLNGILGWVSTTVVRIGGVCNTVPVVIPPTLPAPLPTGTNPVFTATFTSTPPGATATATLPPAPAPTLNFSLPPNYGSTALTSGFVPDPFQVGITSGGTVNVSYLGGGCTGFTTTSPDFSINYTSGAFPTLRMYFVGSGDATMVINTPGGSYFCNDDSFGTLNPTIDFNSPSSGRYDVWIGSFASGTFISGTLSVTENTGNHP
ncbi:MAG: SH3 domain-containing protein [Chloroflexi bacterium]|nr:SH3 domain-containing protein [Chloroflexota bacterium]